MTTFTPYKKIKRAAKRMPEKEMETIECIGRNRTHAFHKTEKRRQKMFSVSYIRKSDPKKITSNQLNLNGEKMWRSPVKVECSCSYTQWCMHGVVINITICFAQRKLAYRKKKQQIHTVRSVCMCLRSFLLLDLFFALFPQKNENNYIAHVLRI